MAGEQAKEASDRAEAEARRAKAEARRAKEQAEVDAKQAEKEAQQAKVHEGIAERRARSADLLNKILAPLAIGTLITTRECPNQPTQGVVDISLHDGRKYREEST